MTETPKQRHARLLKLAGRYRDEGQLAKAVAVAGQAVGVATLSGFEQKPSRELMGDLIRASNAQINERDEVAAEVAAELVGRMPVAVRRMRALVNCEQCHNKRNVQKSIRGEKFQSACPSCAVRMRDLEDVLDELSQLATMVEAAEVGSE